MCRENIPETKTGTLIAYLKPITSAVRAKGISMNSFSRGESAQRAYQQLEHSLESSPLEESISRLEDFIRQYPDFAQAQNDLAVLYYRAGNKLQTLGHYEKAVRLQPENSTFRKNLASFYYVEMGWVDDAIFIYTDILAKTPNDTEVMAALGIISINLDRGTEARAFFTRLLELEPWNNDARMFLAELDSQQAPPPETITVSPTQAKLRTGPAELDAIIADLRKTITSLEDQNLPDDAYANAMALLNQGNEEGAVRELERLVQNHPSHSLAHNDLGVLFQRQGDIRTSRHHHELAVRHDPANATYKKNLAGLYFGELGMTDEAIYLLTEILRSSPNDVETLTGLARIAFTVGRPEEAAIFLRKVVELEPWNQDARELLGRLNSADGFFLATN
jgi:Flp pilus assembly protein TadD